MFLEWLWIFTLTLGFLWVIRQIIVLFVSCINLLKQCYSFLQKFWSLPRPSSKEVPWKYSADTLICFDTDCKGSPVCMCVLLSLTWLPSFCQNTAGGGFPFVPQRKVTVRPWAEIWSRGRTTIWGGTEREKRNLWSFIATQNKSRPYRLYMSF